jgi:diguanylate cyclase (GGDEF)-like protein
MDAALETYIKVLLIDDDEHDRYLTNAYLKGDSFKKYQLQECKNISEAKDLLADNTYDAVLLDLVLPDSQGLKTIDEILPLIDETPLIVLTGLDDQVMGEEAIKMGAEDYLPKKLANTFSLGRAINHSIERHRLVAELKRKAEEDYLTGLPNRSMIYDKLDFMIAQNQRSKRPFSLVMMDFDNFKEINDTRGHRFGDQLIKAFADRLVTIMRKSDYVSRYGGDEFFMIVSNYQDKNELEELLTKKKEALFQPYIVELDGETAALDMTVSIGVIQWRQDLTANQMLEMADQAMYSSKSNDECDITYYD